MPSLLHILKMMMNATTTLYPATKYSTLISTLLNSSFIVIFLNNFASSCLCLCSFLCTSFSLIFVVVLKFHSLHSYCYELQNFENVHNFQQQMQIAFNDYLFLSLKISPITFIFSFVCHHLINE